MVVVVPQIERYEARNASARACPAGGRAAQPRLPAPADRRAARWAISPCSRIVLEDRLIAPLLIAAIPGFDHVVTVAKRSGASAVTLSGNGPALIAFAPSHQRQLADTMVDAFASAGVTARAWVVPLDTQGVVISVAQS